MKFDGAQVRILLFQRGYRFNKIASVLGISPQLLNYRFNTAFSSQDILRLTEELPIPLSEFPEAEHEPTI
jgi:hypothetical protein